jgi:hypothetical protein
MLWICLYLLSILAVYFLIVFWDVRWGGREFQPTVGDREGPWLLIAMAIFWLPVLCVVGVAVLVYCIYALDLGCSASYLYEKTAGFIEKRWPPLKVKEEDEDLVDGPPFLNTQVLDKSVEP